MTYNVFGGTLNLALSVYLWPDPADHKQDTDPTRPTFDDAKSWILRIQYRFVISHYSKM